jgi:hypothetical protein
MSEREASDYITMVVTLPTEEEARQFMRASEEIELMLEGSVVQMINFADYVEGEGPPASEVPTGAWCLLGVIHGPQAKDLPDSDKEAMDTAWAQSVNAILESHDLVADKEETPN